MTFFKKRRTIRRCKTLASYVGGIDDELVQRMADYLLQNPRNTVQATREYLMFVSAAGTIVASKPITPLRDDFAAIAISSSWARVRNPYGHVRQRKRGHDHVRHRSHVPVRPRPQRPRWRR